jgi:hypothetical protein
MVLAALGALGVAAAVSATGGSSNFAWFMVTLSACAVVFAISEVLGLETWIKRGSAKARRAYLVASLALFLAAVAAYLIWQTVALWWLAPIASLPLYLLLMSEDGGRSTAEVDGFSGPLTPPDGSA